MRQTRRKFEDSRKVVAAVGAAALIIAVGSTPAWGQCEVQKLLASNGSSGDSFGRDVDITDDVAIAGGFYSNAAYVYRFDGSAWVEEAVLVAADAIPADLFGRSVAISGDVAVVAAPSDADQGFASGSVYVFRYHPTFSTWIREAKLLASDGALTQFFGASVAISGQTLVVGASGDDNENGDQAGSAYVFRYDGSKWVEEAKLLASDGMTGDLLGWSVAIDRDVVVAGAFGDDDNGAASGSAYVFRFDGAAWVEEAKLLDPQGAPSDNFGSSVAISGDAAVAGSLGDLSGSAFVFRFNGVTWALESKLVAADADGADFFGVSVSIDGDAIVSGASGHSDNGPNAGAAYVFRFDGAMWLEDAKLLPSDGAAQDTFGGSVAVSGDTALVGADADDDNGGGSGSAYVFAGISGVDCNDNGVADACDASADTNGNGIPDVCECPWDCDDFNGDVGINDFLAMLAQWSQVGTSCDIDGGGIGINDLLDLLANWGPCQQP